jgi:hypothetical protein
MRRPLVVVFVWMGTGLGAVGGSILGAAFGRSGLFIGAIVGGVLAAGGSVYLAARFGWLGQSQRRAATLGAVIGFLIAAPIAVSNLHSPVVPVLICSLAGLGAVAGAVVASR